MKIIFIIPGYGIPKDILKDGNYGRYLSLVFNQIYQICSENNERKPVIIFSGGRTDIHKPFRRSEGSEMKKLFITYSRRKFVKYYSKTWRYLTEDRALITMENILNSFKLAGKIKGKKYYYIFVEKSRETRTKILAKKIIRKNFLVLPVDFDLSPNRYRDSKFIKEKEKFDLDLQLKALQDKNFHKKLTVILKDRLEFFRQVGPKKHGEAIYEWWQKKLSEIEKV